MTKHLDEITALKRFLVKLYFKNYTEIAGQCELKLTYKDKNALKRIFFPKRFYRTYYLLLLTENRTMKIEISITEKDSVKYLLQIINKSHD
jgi:hypothetical protein